MLKAGWERAYDPDARCWYWYDVHGIEESVWGEQQPPQRRVPVKTVRFEMEAGDASNTAADGTAPPASSADQGRGAAAAEAGRQEEVRGGAGAAMRCDAM